MKLFKGFSSIAIFVIIIDVIIYTTKAKIRLKIHIYNYKNLDDIKHDGNKCEAFHWLSDYCDPQFHICISKTDKCDILNKTIKAFDNSKIVYNVFLQNLEFETFIDSLSILVRADDGDTHGSHDHIAMFSSNFTISKLNKNYITNMTVIPKNIKVGLQASILITCADNYLGEKCDKRTDEINCLSSCSNGKCVLNSVNDLFVCTCDKGWSGEYCHKRIISTLPVQTTKNSVSEGYNEKYRVLSLDLSTKVIIICLLLLLIVCVISLVLVIKFWHRKMVRNNIFNPISRPLPAIIYEKNQVMNKSAEITFKKSEEIHLKDDSPYETCIIKTNTPKIDNDLIKFESFSDEIESPYEIPLLNHMETGSLSDEEVYKMPIKSNKY